jgi:hypothetical protein
MSTSGSLFAVLHMIMCEHAPLGNAAFIANRPFERSMMAAASSVFYPRNIKRFLENLDFHGLAAEQAL